MELTGPKATIQRAREQRRQMTRPEQLLWSALRRSPIGQRFRKQHPAGPFVLDFYCPAAKLCVEVDGQSHDFTSAHDAARDRWLARQGVRTLRVAARDVMENLAGVVELIRASASAPSAVLRTTPPPEGEGR